ncbi:MAG: hypothetical protein A2513_05150 [Sulfurimonas sp. RIFOXYD12_FULL_33_39]|uniref:hypothetical protein n=1 Tax=unclassified Sulfurimonas TaxID=2623549 RepID=UPI0008C3EF1A|nr:MULTISPECIES: hypothetical protein [unclassified Sulfurimonas]OHE02880.1 MAG: hypothetical protein A3G74_09860 [Sulfurimonas sp. RIFCSPLOWO2_12_FULL_34_6]OHE09508.1 MAG: hypothetical protein A2513_05150 [Sulfurimonas sp. RIFOXYD12_FULL_33_39]OHE12711.1 MAG: hypothetical protein A2530_03655 [Sulfurimonas sp. RIFOXYD2_FULL_34_21]DAB28600.1 MAG TPA: hypothetical protein CFH78_01635 [Sulfurimonas sp. UBA10385]
MALQIINEINKSVTFRFDDAKNRVINIKTNRDVEVDEFLDIQYILDCNKIRYSFEKNFEIQILN